MKIQSRTRGRTEVFRGAPCPSGHEGLRYKSTRQCVECKRRSGRKGSVSQGSLADAVQRQTRWVALFDRNFNEVAKLGIVTVLNSEHHRTPLQAWLYRMRTRWANHPPDRQARLIKLGEEDWWHRIAPPRHQFRIGVRVGTPEHKKRKKEVLLDWRQRNATSIRKKYRTYYQTHPEQRKKAADARTRRFRENPGLAAYLTSLRRKREKAQRCECCSNEVFRRLYLKHAARGLETDHRMSLSIAIELGLKGNHCMTNLQGLTRSEHRIKTSADIGKLAALRRSNNISYHKRTPKNC
jgi:hypothetical protein